MWQLEDMDKRDTATTADYPPTALRDVFRARLLDSDLALQGEVPERRA